MNTQYKITAHTKHHGIKAARVYTDMEAMINDAWSGNVINEWFNDDDVDYIQPTIIENNRITHLKTIRRRHV